MATVVRTITPGVQDQKESGFEVLDTLVEKLGDLGQSAFEVLRAYMNLPLSAPTMAAVIGIISNDLLAHKFNVIQWTHEEEYCTTCNAWVSLYDWLIGVHQEQNLVTKIVPGLITRAANLQIAGVILGSFGVSAAGAIISDITQISKIVGASNPAPLTTPSVTTLNLPIGSVSGAGKFKVS